MIKLKHIIYDLIVICLVLAYVAGMNEVFLLKDENYYNYQNYIRQEKNSIDVLVLGSSHSLYAIDSNDINQLMEDHGKKVKTFNMSVQGMRFETMEFRLKEALKTQNPSVLIIETFSGNPNYYTDEMTRRLTMDYVPLSLNKIRFIYNHFNEDKSSYIFPILRYHSRWNELEKRDFKVLNPFYVRRVCSDYGIKATESEVMFNTDDAYFSNDFSNLSESEPLAEDIDRSLSNILKIAEENNIKVLLLSLPYKIQMGYDSTQLIKNNNYIEEKYCNNNSVYMLDLNKEYKQLNWSFDYMQDEGHMNIFGRKAVEPYIVEFIIENLY